MATKPKRPLIPPGHEASWAEFTREKEREKRQEDELIARMSVGERLELGQRLSQQRVQLLNEFRARHGLDRS